MILTKHDILQAMHPLDLFTERDIAINPLHDKRLGTHYYDIHLYSALCTKPSAYIEEGNVRESRGGFHALAPSSRVCLLPGSGYVAISQEVITAKNHHILFETHPKVLAGIMAVVVKPENDVYNSKQITIEILNLTGEQVVFSAGDPLVRAYFMPIGQKIPE